MSTIKTNKFQTLDGFTYNVPVQVVTSSLGAADLGTTDTATSDRTNLSPAWSIITTTTAWTDTTNLQLTITPKFSTSLIKLELSMYLRTNVSTGDAAGIRIRRGNKIVWRPIHDTTGPYSTFWTNVALHPQLCVVFMDQPSTTSPVTYTLQYRTYNGGTAQIFGPASGAYGNSQYLIATEIAQ